MRPGLIVVALAAVGLARASTGGISGTLSANGVNYIVGQVVPVVEQALDSLTIPDTAGDVGATYSLRAHSSTHSGRWVDGSDGDSSPPAGLHPPPLLLHASTMRAW
jgi:hypothetical protein